MKRALALAMSSLVALACGRTPAEPSGSTSSDASVPSTAFDAALPPCVSNPTTYLEIINACTDAEAVDKAVDLSSMSLSDGGRQPLP